MKAKTKLTRLWGFLLALVMIVGMLPTTAFAAGNPDPTAVFVDGGKSFYNNRLYYKKGDQDKNFTGNEGDYADAERLQRREHLGGRSQMF